MRISPDFKTLFIERSGYVEVYCTKDKWKTKIKVKGEEEKKPENEGSKDKNAEKKNQKKNEMDEKKNEEKNKMDEKKNEEKDQKRDENKNEKKSTKKEQYNDKEVSEYRIAQMLPLSQAKSNSLILSPEGDKLIVFASDGKSVLWTRPAAQPEAAPKISLQKKSILTETPDKKIKVLSLSDDQLTLFALFKEGSLVVYDRKNKEVDFGPGKPLKKLKLEGNPRVVMSKDSKTLLCEVIKIGEKEKGSKIKKIEKLFEIYTRKNPGEHFEKKFETFSASEEEFMKKKTLKQSKKGGDHSLVPEISPDSKLVAYWSPDSGENEIEIEEVDKDKTKNGEEDKEKNKIKELKEIKIVELDQTDNEKPLWKSDNITLEGEKGHQARVICLKFSPDNLLLASASEDCKLILWERTSVRSKKFSKKQEFEFRGQKITSIDFSKDSELIFLGSSNAELHILRKRKKPLIKSNGFFETTAPFSYFNRFWRQIWEKPENVYQFFQSIIVEKRPPNYDQNNTRKTSVSLSDEGSILVNTENLFALYDKSKEEFKPSARYKHSHCKSTEVIHSDTEYILASKKEAKTR